MLSGNKKHDLQTKKNLYEKSGVKEYFIVNPDSKEVIANFFDGEKFVLQEGRKSKVKSKLLKKTFTF